MVWWPCWGSPVGNCVRHWVRSVFREERYMPYPTWVVSLALTLTWTRRKSIPLSVSFVRCIEFYRIRYCNQVVSTDNQKKIHLGWVLRRGLLDWAFIWFLMHAKLSWVLTPLQQPIRPAVLSACNTWAKGWGAREPCSNNAILCLVSRWTLTLWWKSIHSKKTSAASSGSVRTQP